MTRLAGSAVLAALLLLGASAVRAEAPRERTTIFHVEGMTCFLCSRAIRSTVREVPGVSDVRVDRKAERVEIVAAEDVQPAALEAAIEGAGSYEAELVGPGSGELVR